MGVDVYTPAYNRLCKSTDYLEICSRYNRWSDRPTVATQEWTEDDACEYEATTAIRDRMEHDAGNFRHRAPFASNVPPIAAFERESAHSVQLTHTEVGQYLAEWRRYLRVQVALGKHLDKYINGFGESAMSPFDVTVQLFKNWCIVYRLGEGCYII